MQKPKMTRREALVLMRAKKIEAQRAVEEDSLRVNAEAEASKKRFGELNKAFEDGVKSGREIMEREIDDKLIRGLLAMGVLDSNNPHPIAMSGPLVGAIARTLKRLGFDDPEVPDKTVVNMIWQMVKGGTKAADRDESRAAS